MKKSSNFQFTLGDVFFEGKSVFPKDIEEGYDAFLIEKQERAKRLAIARSFGTRANKTISRRDH